MAAVTSTLVALGGVGLSAAQAIKANKDMKKASSQYDLANKNLKAIKETNQFKGVQVPRLGFELAQQGQDQQTQQAIAALQGTGAEGIIGGIGQLVGAGNEAYLQQAAQANNTQFQRDMAQAEAGQGIEARRAEREYNIGTNEAMDASIRRAESEANRNAAIGSAFGSLGAAAEGIDGMIDLYKNKSLGADAQRVPGMGIGVLQQLPKKPGAIPAIAQQGASMFNMMGMPALNSTPYGN